MKVINYAVPKFDCSLDGDARENGVHVKCRGRKMQLKAQNRGYFWTKKQKNSSSISYFL